MRAANKNALYEAELAEKHAASDLQVKADMKRYSKIGLLVIALAAVAAACNHFNVLDQVREMAENFKFNEAHDDTHITPGSEADTQAVNHTLVGCGIIAAITLIIGVQVWRASAETSYGSVRDGCVKITAQEFNHQSKHLSRKETMALQETKEYHDFIAFKGGKNLADWNWQVKEERENKKNGSTDDKSSEKRESEIDEIEINGAELEQQLMDIDAEFAAQPDLVFKTDSNSVQIAKAPSAVKNQGKPVGYVTPKNLKQGKQQEPGTASTVGHSELKELSM